MKNTATSSVVPCKLNKTFSDAIKSKRFIKGRAQKEGMFGLVHYDALIDKKHPKRTHPRTVASGMTCCGIEEIDFQALQPLWKDYWDEGKEVFRTWVANYIRACFSERDSRVLITGLPISRTVNSNSQYDFTFYGHLKDSLKELGFVQTGKEYVNRNSRNKLVVLVGQFPSR